MCHCQPYTMWRNFEGSIYWDELAEIHVRGDISRAVGFRRAAKFRGNTLLTVKNRPIV